MDWNLEFCLGATSSLILYLLLVLIIGVAYFLYVDLKCNLIPYITSNESHIHKWNFILMHAK